MRSGLPVRVDQMVEIDGARKPALVARRPRHLVLLRMTRHSQGVRVVPRAPIMSIEGSSIDPQRNEAGRAPTP